MGVKGAVGTQLETVNAPLDSGVRRNDGVAQMDSGFR